MELYEAAIRAGVFQKSRGWQSSDSFWQANRSGKRPWLFLIGLDETPGAVVTVVSEPRPGARLTLSPNFAFSEEDPSPGKGTAKEAKYAELVRERIDREPMRRLASVFRILDGLYSVPDFMRDVPSRVVFWDEVIPSGEEILGKPTVGGEISILLGDLPREFVAPVARLLEEDP